MLSRQWRERLTYAAMSMFVGWHTLAMVVAPASDASELVQPFRAALNPYLSLFELDHQSDQWGFFAPDPGRGDQLRYVIEDASGKGHIFVPSDKLSWLLPTYNWFRQWYGIILDAPTEYGKPFAVSFCREHASLRPVSVTFLRVLEGDFKPADHLNGKHPLDPEFATVSAVGQFNCPRQ